MIVCKIRQRKSCNQNGTEVTVMHRLNAFINWGKKKKILEWSSQPTCQRSYANG